MLPQSPSPASPRPDLHALVPFAEPEYDDDYYEEMIHNVDFEDPDPKWSDWGSNPFGFPASSSQKKYAISFFDGEEYQQEGFHSDSSLDSARTISEDWLVEANNILEDPVKEIMPLPLSQPAELQQTFSPSIFLVSDIEESELFPNTDLRSPAIKRLNPEKQSYLHSVGIGSSSGPESSRIVISEEHDQWTNIFQSAKRFKLDSMDQTINIPSIISIIYTFNISSVEEKSTRHTTFASPAATL
ncbi:hypothetical protein C5167_009936 [Papaver somniferum]|uniref:Uncharacterized protein n=1 Tax=Papaver somniferum TaxID=3469 RepID=A0A4Y7K1M7_PAPSO|nr:hypothetical protein C5167_009936 [Papaver somniferum]